VVPNIIQLTIISSDFVLSKCIGKAMWKHTRVRDMVLGCIYYIYSEFVGPRAGDPKKGPRVPAGNNM